jgi:hypothetical protein
MMGVQQTKPSSVSLAVRSFVVIFERLLLLERAYITRLRYYWLGIDDDGYRYTLPHSPSSQKNDQ